MQKNNKHLYFIDFYFGEFILLVNDIKKTKGVKNKFLYLIKPPGWTPETTAYTAAATRGKFLNENPGLDVTSRNLLLQNFLKPEV